MMKMNENPTQLMRNHQEKDPINFVIKVFHAMCSWQKYRIIRLNSHNYQHNFDFKF